MTHSANLALNNKRLVRLMMPNPRLELLDQIQAEIPKLRRFARFLTRDNDLSDDLVQECLVRSIANLDKFTPGTNLRAWLRMILKNHFINHARRAKREVVTDICQDSARAPVVPADQDTRMALLEVRDAFGSLSEEHREVLLLIAVDGFSYEEAADVINVPVGTIRSRLSRARQALRSAVEYPVRNAAMAANKVSR